MIARMEVDTRQETIIVRTEPWHGRLHWDCARLAEISPVVTTPPLPGLPTCGAGLCSFQTSTPSLQRFANTAPPLAMEARHRNVSQSSGLAPLQGTQTQYSRLLGSLCGCAVAHHWPFTTAKLLRCLAAKLSDGYGRAADEGVHHRRVVAKCAAKTVGGRHVILMTATAHVRSCGRLRELSM